MKSKMSHMLHLLTSWLLGMCIFVHAADAEVIHNFGNWRIEKVVASDGSTNYILIGVGEVADPLGKFRGARFIQLKCSSASKVRELALPYDLKSQIDKPIELKHVVVHGYYWRAGAEPSKIKLYRIDEVFAITQSTLGIDKFMSAALEASGPLSISINEKHLLLDVGNFKVARSVFKDLCGTS